MPGPGWTGPVPMLRQAAKENGAGVFARQRRLLPRLLRQLLLSRVVSNFIDCVCCSTWFNSSGVCACTQM